MNRANKNNLSGGQIWGRKGQNQGWYLVQSVNATSGDAMCKDLINGGLMVVANSVFDQLERKN